MAIKRILRYGEPSLREVSKEVHKVSKKISDLVRDLLDTMYAQNGVGLPARQIGEIKSNEGCLSFPEAYTDVKRYKNVMVKALNEHGKPFVMEAKDGTLLARAIQHEFDHLDGILFIDHCINRFETESVLQKYSLPNLDPEKLLEEKELEDELANND